LIEPSSLRAASITAWGAPGWGSTSAPADKGYIKIYSNEGAFTAVKACTAINAVVDNDFIDVFLTA
jgi:hypothetical protein